MDDKVEEITLISLQTSLNSLLFDFKKLRTDWETFEDKILDHLSELDALKNQLKTATPSKIPISASELMKFKQLGIKPQSLLRQLGFNVDEEKKGIEGEEVSRKH